MHCACFLCPELQHHHLSFSCSPLIFSPLLVYCRTFNSCPPFVFYHPLVSSISPHQGLSFALPFPFVFCSRFDPRPRFVSHPPLVLCPPLAPCSTLLPALPLFPALKDWNSDFGSNKRKEKRLTVRKKRLLARNKDSWQVFLTTARKHLSRQNNA